MNTAQQIILFGQQKWRNYLSALAGNVPKSLWNPNDLSLQYQGSTGITPVTAVEQPVGLVLDSLTKGQRGSELVTNGDFSGGLTGWTAQNSSTQSLVTGRCEVTATAAGVCSSSTPVTLVAGKTYEATGLGRVDLAVGGGGAILLVSTSAPLDSAVGFSNLNPTFSDVVLRCVFVATATTMYVGVRNTVVAIGDRHSFDNISVREIPGNHLIQPTSTARPILSGRVNLLLATATLSTQNVTTIAASYTLRFTGTGTITLSGTSTAGPLVGGGTLTFTPTAGTLTLTVTGFVTLADLRLTADTLGTLPPYQAVVTSTNYDTVGFPIWWRCNGVESSFYTTASVNLSGISKLTAFVASQKAADATQIIAELGTGASAADTGFSFSGGIGTLRSILYDATTNISAINNVAIGISAIQTTIFDHLQPTTPTKLQAFINGAAGTAAFGGPLSTTNFGNRVLHIGRRNNSSLPFNGLIGPIGFYGTTMPPAQLKALTKLLGKDTGVPIT